jgi:hypothetical protein
MDIEHELRFLCPEVKFSRFSDEHFQAEIICEANGKEASLHLLENKVVVTGPLGTDRLPAEICRIDDLSHVVDEVRKRLSLVESTVNQ